MRDEVRYIGMTLGQILEADRQFELVRSAWLSLIELDSDLEVESMRIAEAKPRDRRGGKREERWLKWIDRIHAEFDLIDIALRRAILQRRIVLQLIAEGRIDPRQMHVTATPGASLWPRSSASSQVEKGGPGSPS